MEPTVAGNGMVATSHPIAAQVGVDILKSGGNAIDAAVATNAAMGLMEPMACGIGGDLFALVWDARQRKLFGLSASGRSAYAAAIGLFDDHALDFIPTHGPLSWSVPGCVDGWDQLLKKFGTMPLAKLLEPAIDWAQRGVPTPPVIANTWNNAAEFLRETPEAAATFLVDGHSPRAGEMFRNPRLAETYRHIARDGRDGFYHGRIADQIVAYSDSVGGLFSRRDFQDHESNWVQPVSTNYRGHDVWEIPPPGQGIAVLQMLNLLEGFDLASMGAASADWWHLFIEAKKLAYADRAINYADPDFADVPLEFLISKSYANNRRRRIDMLRAADNVPPGEPARGDTIYLSVVDKDRNCVSLIQSNFDSFGSRHVPGDLGFALQNRGNSFSLDRNHRNALAPHKRPFHTIIPGFVTRGGEPHFVFGVMGGDMQPQGQVQVLVNLLDFQMNIQTAGDTPRMQHFGSATPTGRAANGAGEVLAEPGIGQSVVDDLQSRGHIVGRTEKNPGGYQGILIDRERNMLLGASESRRDGRAIGY
ncbi:MAG: gamma-glutamyltranspeptidase / glutathione hydrolase [Phycisphaerales bacterium]|jgi:gamma-glutamyltranspeptidase/glutathione hydrolase|nr:gamma-glutamyltranspeptidase / glutathione hydrolase [Phycisphaerales bacterium]